MTANDPTAFAPSFRNRRPRRRAALCLVFGAGLVLAWVLSARQAPAGVLVAAGLCLGTVLWLAVRRPSTGMEITGAEWRFHVGRRRWRVPLSDIASVSVLRWEARPASVAITFVNGRTDILPEALEPDVDQLTDDLLRRGIRVLS
jgi:hypothetical protein